MLYTIYSIQNIPPALAGNEFFCSVSFGPCSFGGFVEGESCAPNFVLPCESGDCCLEYYNQNASCPNYLYCIPEPTPTPTPLPGSTSTPVPLPSPTGTPWGCPGPYGTYCNDSETNYYPCQPDQYCNTNNIPPGLPQGCSGVCTSLTPIPIPTDTTTSSPYDPCSGVTGESLTACEACTSPIDGVPQGTYTAIGCIPTEPQAFVSVFIKWAISVGAGIAFLLIIYGAFTVITAAGEPEKLKAGQETITSAITGILFIIFAIFLLRFIGADLLKIPGFS